MHTYFKIDICNTYMQPEVVSELLNISIDKKIPQLKGKKSKDILCLLCFTQAYITYKQ